MNPDSLAYQKSIAREFEAYKDRVRNLIGSNHWGEEGRYKEIILINFLKRFLPSTVSVGTGFVKTEELVSTQLDIIIYNHNIPLYFKEKDFVIIQPEALKGIIEVKSSPNMSDVGDAICKSNKITVFETAPYIFNGLFIFGEASSNPNYSSKLLKKPRINSKLKKYLSEALNDRNGVNHIVSNDGAFLKKTSDQKSFQCYAIKELATSYFFSNLLSMLGKMDDLSIINSSMYKHLYPIKEGKRSFKRWDITQE